MNDPPNLHDASRDHVEHEEVLHDEYAVSQTAEAVVGWLLAGAGEETETRNGAVDPINEYARCGWAISSDVVDNVEKVPFREREVLDAITPAHRILARSLRITARWLTPLAPRAAWLSASASVRYRSSCACSRS